MPLRRTAGRVTNADLALVLTGGGARGAYQVGVLRYLASRYPDLSPGILTGVSAGGIIATHLASGKGRSGPPWPSLRPCGAICTCRMSFV